MINETFEHFQVDIDKWSFRFIESSNEYIVMHSILWNLQRKRLLVMPTEISLTSQEKFQN